MADVIMTFRYLNEVQVQPSKVLMRVGIVGAGNDMTMHLDYNPRHSRCRSVRQSC